MDGANAATANQNISRSTTVNSCEMFDSGVGGHDCRTSVILENSHAEEDERTLLKRVNGEEQREEKAPTVTFSMTVHKLSVSMPTQVQLKAEGPDERKRRQSTAEEGAVAVKILTQSSLPAVGEENGSAIVAVRNNSRTESSASTEGTTTVGEKGAGSIATLKKQLSKNGGLAVRLVKKNTKSEQSLKRKVSKSQRKEKRATKTLGIVVGIFLVCWVPFFTLNIASGIIQELQDNYNVTMEQIDFKWFFYSTWLGYMNSFMNPLIYTIFNTEFRRAFKSLLFGRQHMGAGGARAV